MKKTIRRGFSLVELIVVLVMFGLLATMALPRYLQKSDQELQSAKHGMSSAVKGAFSVYINRHRAYPTLAELSTIIHDGRQPEPAQHRGIEVEIKGARYVVPTYVNALCTQSTSSLQDRVQCVGSIPRTS
jgi:prepilin-type N-terminal cleavage/methylation domain-containing protein